MLKNLDEFVVQAMAMSKAVSDRDTALKSILANTKLVEALFAAAKPFYAENNKLLDALFTTVSEDIRKLCGIRTDKLTRLKEAMEKELGPEQAIEHILNVHQPKE